MPIMKDVELMRFACVLFLTVGTGVGTGQILDQTLRLQDRIDQRCGDDYFSTYYTLCNYGSSCGSIEGSSEVFPTCYTPRRDSMQFCYGDEDCMNSGESCQVYLDDRPRCGGSGTTALMFHGWYSSVSIGTSYLRCIEVDPSGHIGTKYDCDCSLECIEKKFMVVYSVAGINDFRCACSNDITSLVGPPIPQYEMYTSENFSSYFSPSDFRTIISTWSLIKPYKYLTGLLAQDSRTNGGRSFFGVRQVGSPIALYSRPEIGTELQVGYSGKYMFGMRPDKQWRVKGYYSIKSPLEGTVLEQGDCVNATCAGITNQYVGNGFSKDMCENCWCPTRCAEYRFMMIADMSYLSISGREGDISLTCLCSDTLDDIATTEVFLDDTSMIQLNSSQPYSYLDSLDFLPPVNTTAIPGTLYGVKTYYASKLASGIGVVYERSSTSDPKPIDLSVFDKLKISLYGIGGVIGVYLLLAAWTALNAADSSDYDNYYEDDD